MEFWPVRAKLGLFREHRRKMWLKNAVEALHWLVRLSAVGKGIATAGRKKSPESWLIVLKQVCSEKVINGPNELTRVCAQWIFRCRGQQNLMSHSPESSLSSVRARAYEKRETERFWCW